MALPRENRLIRKKDFDNVFASGESFSLGSIAVRFAKSPANTTRIGIVVLAKAFKRAVDRNRVKRVILGAVQDRFRDFPFDVDLVIMVRPMFDEKEADGLIAKVAEKLSRVRIKQDVQSSNKDNKGV